MKTLLSILFFLSILGATVLPTTKQTINVKGKTVVANKSPAVKCFRLVHDGKAVKAMFESTGVTQTINTLYCATTQAEIDAEISRLKLTLPEKDAKRAARAGKSAKVK